MTNGEALGKKLYELRKKNGLSQEELAERLGVSRQAVSKWECGESMPDTDNLITIARMYAISLDELVGNDTVTKSEPIGIDCESEAREGDCEPAGEKSTLLEDLYGIACPLLVTAAYLLCGFLWGIWHIAWVLFFIIPTYYSLVDTIKQKKFSEFPVVFIVTAIYCLIGMVWGLWDFWFLFITVPIYYEIAEAIDKKLEKRKNSSNDKEMP